MPPPIWSSTIDPNSLAIIELTADENLNKKKHTSRMCSKEAFSLHGGVGFEHDVHLVLRRYHGMREFAATESAERLLVC